MTSLASARMATPTPYEIDLRPKAQLWEQAILAVWFLVTFISFPGDEVLLYPIALFFVASIALRRRVVVPVMLRSWIIFTIPIMAALSAYWAPAFTPALRFGIMMILTASIAVFVAVRFTPKQIIQSLFAAGAVAVIMVAPHFDSFAYGGPYGEKNIFANRMLMALLASLAIAYNHREGAILRLVALPFIPVAFVFIVVSESATNLVFAMVSVLVMTMIWLFWSGFGTIRHLRSIMLLAIIAVATIIIIYITSQPNITLLDDILGALGKDSTLTGRTMLWDAADRIVKERPWFGVGAEGFWIFNRGDAQTLLELSFKDPGTRFSFHSAYYETQVHLGRLGLILLYLTLAWCITRSTLAWFRKQDIEHSFFLLITGIVFVSSFTEAWLFTVFDVGATLFYASAVSTLLVATKLHLAMVPVDALPEDMLQGGIATS